MRMEINRVLDLLRTVEWSGFDDLWGESYCAQCGGAKQDGHAPHCELLAVMQEIEEELR